MATSRSSEASAQRKQRWQPSDKRPSTRHELVKGAFCTGQLREHQASYKLSAFNGPRGIVTWPCTYSYSLLRLTRTYSTF